MSAGDGAGEVFNGGAAVGAGDGLGGPAAFGVEAGADGCGAGVGVGVGAGAAAGFGGSLVERKTQKSNRMFLHWIQQRQLSSAKTWELRLATSLSCLVTSARCSSCEAINHE